MNDDARDAVTKALMELSIAKQVNFDAVARELHDRRAAWKADEDRLVDRLSALLRGVDKIKGELAELQCMAPDIIAEESAVRALRDAQKGNEPRQLGGRN